MTREYQKISDRELDNVSGGIILLAARLSWRAMHRAKKVVAEEAQYGKRVNPFRMWWKLLKP